MYCYCLLVFTAIMLSGETVISKTKKCSFDERCLCQKTSKELNMFKADCSKRNFTAIPKLSNNILELNLSWNKIEKIVDGSFISSTKLLTLDLSHNRIKDIEKYTLKGLGRLETLLINDNNITHVDNQTFSHIPRIKLVNFKMNNFSSLILDFSYTPLIANIKLDVLPSQNNQILNPVPPNLLHLDISGLSGKCEMKAMTNETFVNFPKLQSLNASKCQINFIHTGTFRPLTGLRYLDLSYNRCLGSNGFKNITHDISYTSISILKINKIQQTFALNMKLTISHLEKLAYTRLTELHADSNRIQLFERGALLKLPPTLRYISLADNQFSFGDYFLDLFHLSVHFVNLSYNSISHDITDKPEQCDNRPQGFQEIEMYENGNQEASPVAQYLGPSFFLLPPNMTTLIHSHCNLRYEIVNLYFPRNKLVYLDLSYNVFHSWIGPVQGTNYLEHADLSNNYCSNVSLLFLRNFYSLKTLLIQNNLLGFVFPSDVNGRFLEGVPNLQKLDLSSNRVPDLPRKFFKNQASLTSLFINDNMLNDITFEIGHMSNLSYLDLSNNKLSTLSDDVREKLDTIFEHNKHLTIDLHGNRFHCHCSSISFVEWISTTNINIKNIHKTDCELIDKTIVSLQNAALLYSRLKKECSSYTSLILATVSLMVLFGVVLIWGIVYRYRWKLRYWYYMVKSRHQGIIKTPTTCDSKIYQFDAFISYSDKDGDFVHKALLDNLEKETDLKLCIHKRDFLPGNDIASNITSAVHSSRKTVVILSQNYLESYWCMFEYKMARMESIYARQKENILFLIFLEQISPKQLPLDILELVQTQSYIEFPNDPQGDVVFWNKMTDVLSE